MPKEAVVFDFDGTLAELNLDFGHMARGVEALARRMGYGGPWPGGYLLEAMALAAPRAEPGFLAAAEALIRDIEVEAASRGALFGFSEDLLKALGRARWARAVITRNCEDAVRRVFPRVDELCEAFVPRERAPKPKPRPEHVLQALEAVGAAPEDSWMVGDHPTDMQAGRAAGCRCAGVRSGRTAAEDLRRAGAHEVLDHAGLLPGLLGL